MKNNILQLTGTKEYMNGTCMLAPHGMPAQIQNWMIISQNDCFEAQKIHVVTATVLKTQYFNLSVNGFLMFQVLFSWLDENVSPWSDKKVQIQENLD